MHFSVRSACYPVCPGDVNYLIGSPLFDKATLKVANRQEAFVITAGHNGPQEPYIHGATAEWRYASTLNLSSPRRKSSKGGELVFKTDSSAPDYKWAATPESRHGFATQRNFSKPANHDI